MSIGKICPSQYLVIFQNYLSYLSIYAGLLRRWTAWLMMFILISLGALHFQGSESPAPAETFRFYCLKRQQKQLDNLKIIRSLLAFDPSTNHMQFRAVVLSKTKLAIKLIVNKIVIGLTEFVFQN